MNFYLNYSIVIDCQLDLYRHYPVIYLIEYFVILIDSSQIRENFGLHL
jgi:hypothetical protein